MRWFTNLKIGKKLLLVALIVLFTMAGMGTFFIARMHAVYEEANYGNVNSVPSLDVMFDLNGSIKDFYVAILRHIQNTDPARMAMIEELIKKDREETEKSFAAYEKLLSDDTDKQMLATDRDLFQQLVRAEEELIVLSRANKNEEARTLLREKGLPVYEKLDKALEEHGAYNIKLAEQGAKLAAEEYSSTRTLGIIIIAVASCAIFAFMLLISRMISAPVTKAAALAETMAQGNFTAKLDIV